MSFFSSCFRRKKSKIFEKLDKKIRAPAPLILKPSDTDDFFGRLTQGIFILWIFVLINLSPENLFPERCELFRKCLKKYGKRNFWTLDGRNNCLPKERDSNVSQTLVEITKDKESDLAIISSIVYTYRGEWNMETCYAVTLRFYEVKVKICIFS